MKKIELLAPAGDLERLKVTLLYGADAVYLGGPKLGLRANAVNFTIDEIKQGCDFAHQLSKKVYVTVNIVFHEEDRVGMEEYLKQLVDCHVDGLIVSDIYVITYMRKHYPNVEVHLSTQASVTNALAAKFYYDLGVSRIVLAREVGKADIKEIVDAGINVEVFIHGAMCTCFSGRCALSNYVTNRDANRGGCAQVCRFAFLNEKDHFTMASKDLNMAPYIKDLIDMGVVSLKIEGRMRSIYYLATVISCYRKLIDAVYDDSLTDEMIEGLEKILSRVANREVSSQFFLHEADGADQYYTGRSEVSNQDYLGVVTGYDKKKMCIEICQRNYFKVGDKVEIFTPSGESYFYEIRDFYDENGNLLTVANHPEQVLSLPFDSKLPAYSMMRLLEKG